MLYRNADADHRPERVTVEPLPNGETAVRLADNITEYTAEETPERVMFRFDEVSFTTGGYLTAEEIDADFAKWWEIGQMDTAPEPVEEVPAPEEEEIPMTRSEMSALIRAQQEQIAILEDCVMEMSEVVYA